MKSYAILVILLIICFQSHSEIVEIDDGKLDGTMMRSRKGIEFHAFLKIPFAQPPVGNLRFKAPLRNDKWEDVYNAKEYGPMCSQYINFGALMSENCLHLNVYTRSISSGNLKPVIVYIHGGALEVGSGVVEKPNYLMDRDVVVVTINYRLGPLGFLAIGKSDAMGSMGLKDQTLALQWVQRNIEKFGGDHLSVTLAGLSAGSISATAHMVSEMSKGLFHKVIALSSAITWQKGLESNNLKNAQRLAANLNCSANVDAIVECLQWVNFFYLIF